MSVSKRKESDNPTSVAIVGGGISGLSVAYTLVQSGFDGKITVVEKRPTLGGNAATAEVTLGEDFRGDGLITNFDRLADLGVNDVNLQSYIKLVQAMKNINYPINEQLRALEDTVAHFTPDFKEVWTKDGYLTGTAQPYKNIPIDDRRGVVDTRHSLHIVDSQLANDEHTFMEIAAKDYDSAHRKDKPDYWYYSVAKYIKYFEKHWLPETEISKENLQRLVRLFLYPRISAMYFADPSGPAGMPMLGIMSYYQLQEGIGISGGSGIDRRYFAQGSQHWIQALAKWLQTNDKNRVTILREFDAAVVGIDGRVNVINLSKPNSSTDHLVVDQVVMAGHADHQLESFKTTLSGEQLLSKEMEDNLSSVQHSKSYAYAHTWNRLLPPNPGSWRTYNVMIRTDDPTRPEPPETKIPYQMTYVQNRHRNDRHHEDYNQYGMPVYFVSLNPQWDIPKEYVLQRTSDDTKKAIKDQAGYGRKLDENDPQAQLAFAEFRHTKMTEKLLKIQADLSNHQGMAEGRVFFAGCWTNGAGLHEECFEQAETVVAQMLKTKESSSAST